MRSSSSVSMRLFGLLLMSRMEIRTKSRWNLIVTVVLATKKSSAVPAIFSMEETGRAICPETTGCAHGHRHLSNNVT